MKFTRTSRLLSLLLILSSIIPQNRSFAVAHRDKSSISQSPTFRNWGLLNSNPANSHIDAVDAWKITNGSKNVIVAVIDTGIDPNHKDLKDNLLKGPNGYGYDFVRNQPSPTDEHGHGTHVAGIIGAIANSKEGISGVSHLVSIMPVKYYSESNPGSVNLENTIKAIYYAVDHGARIINYSGGGPEWSDKEYLAIKYAESKGVLLIAAAGNERQDTDIESNYYFPAAYRLSNTISVAAIDINGKVLRSSNWGKTHVDVAAPGENIYSTLPGNRYGQMSGTSQATAFVSGLAALLLAKNPALTPQEIRKLIIDSSDRLPALIDKVVSNGKVNAFSALLLLGKSDFVNRSVIARELPTIPEKLALGTTSILKELMKIPDILSR